eukprot:CAMPEP_0180195880 /NCGR_PEP_ID=MMETSP0987-20121128/3821_1 /TAXON_ID=697907 /ORGANISM="non described non described, Strain CCMP2293" /LENGTH=90 /DNA_ID=CAMNT_0022150747 /DNA_START=400 /DNA_END=668 /DNA_ORIENTATION=+
MLDAEVVLRAHRVQHVDRVVREVHAVAGPAVAPRPRGELRPVRRFAPPSGEPPLAEDQRGDPAMQRKLSPEEEQEQERHRHQREEEVAFL